MAFNNKINRISNKIRIDKFLVFRVYHHRKLCSLKIGLIENETACHIFSIYGSSVVHAKKVEN